EMQMVADAHTQPVRCRRTQEQRVRAQQVQTILRLGNQTWLDARCAEGVDAQDLQDVLAAAQLGVDLDDRARQRYFRKARKLRVQALVEAAAWTADLQIGLSGEHLHSERELVDRGCRDELYRVSKRDPEGDRKQRQQASRLVVRESSGENRAACGGDRCGRHRVSVMPRSQATSRSPCWVSISVRSHVAAATRECVTRMPAAPCVFT